MKFPTCFSRYGLSPAPPAAWRSHSAKNVQIWAAPRHPSLENTQGISLCDPLMCRWPRSLGWPRWNSQCPALHHQEQKEIALPTPQPDPDPHHLQRGASAQILLVLLKGRPVLPGKKHTSEVIPNKKSGLSWEQRKNILVIFLIQLKVLRCTKVCPGSLARRVHLGPVLGAVCVQVLKSAALLLPCNSVS